MALLSGMVTMSHVEMNPFSIRARLAVGSLILPLLAHLGPSPRSAAAEGSLAITGAVEATNTVEFTFTSTWPVGTSYQPQFQRAVGGGWVDLPDARIEEVDAAAGLFRVSAPRFGGTSGFYRVLNSESLPDDPAGNTLDEPDPQELFILTSRLSPLPQTGSTTLYSGQVLFHAQSPGGGPVDNQFSTNAVAQFAPNGSPEATGDVLMSDLDGDGRVEPLIVWTDANNRMVISIAEVDPSTLAVTQRATIPVPDHTVRTTSGVPPLVRVQRARYVGGENPRVWLAWLNTLNHVQFELFEFRGNLTELVPLASFIVMPTVASGSPGSLLDRSGWFDIASGDFDGDGADELAVLLSRNATVPNGLNNWEVYARFFKHLSDTPPFLGVDTITESERVVFLKDGRNSVFLRRLAGLAEDFDADGRAELAVVYETTETGQGDSRWFMQFLKPNPGLSSLAKAPAQPGQVDSRNGGGGYPLDLQAGEFDGDPELELVVAGRQVRLYDVQPDLAFSPLSEAGHDTSEDSSARRSLVLANLDARDPNTGFRPEIVVATIPDENGASPLVTSYEVTGSGATGLRMETRATLRVPSTGFSFQNPDLVHAIGVADFGQNGPKLGTPRRYTRTITGKPIVIVNAPPVHFDVLGGVAYDVNGMFPTADCIGGECPFYSRYTVQSTTSIEVQTDWERGWNVGQKVEGGTKLPLDIGVKAEIEAKYGGRFDSFASTNTTTTVEVQVDAVADDRVYATTISYTVWEYPVLVDGEIVTYIVAYAPDVTRQNWFGSKSIVAQNYRPYHEVGNLLSYRSATEPYPGAEYVRSIDSADTFTVDSSSSYVWRLTRTTASTTTESRTFNFSIQARASFDLPVPWIPDVELSGGYDSTTLAANTTTLTDQQGLVARLGALDGAVAGTAYSLTPYFYWDRSGALVLDYAVDLFTGTAGQPTFWGRHYTAKSDPAFVLPWRLDPEKGFAVLNEAQRRLTRDIATVPAEPRPGQEVELVARLSNFSFLGTPTSFRVRFYLGDPAEGGQLLVNNSGEDYVLVPAGIPARGKRQVTFPWRIPESAASASLLVYCVIDADQQLDEIHEDNNVGWNEIFLRTRP